MFSTPGLDQLYASFFAQDPGSVPGSVPIKVPVKAQYDYNIGPVARVAADMRTGSMEVSAGPAEIDITLRTPMATMSSLLPAFEAFAQGKAFKMPYNLEISIPDTTTVEEQESKKQEALIVRKLCQRDPPIFFNPSKFVMGVAHSTGARIRVASAQQWEEKYRDEVAAYPGMRYVYLFDEDPRSLVYTGSLGIPIRASRWLCLQPRITHPQVEGVQYHSWGVAYQCRRAKRSLEMYFEFEPPEHRYTTKEFFGIETDFFVRTSESKQQEAHGGIGKVLGFSFDPTPRLHGNLGEIRDNGPYVIREDTVAPQEHDMYRVVHGVLHYGDLPPANAYAYDLRNHVWTSLAWQDGVPDCRYATFYEEGEHSEDLFTRSMGSVWSARVAHESDSAMADYGAGTALPTLHLPVQQREVTRERAMAYIFQGKAILYEGILEIPFQAEVVVRGSNVPLEQFLRMVMNDPVRRVHLDPDIRRYLVLRGFHIQKGVRDTSTVFPPSIPTVGWAEYEGELAQFKEVEEF